MLTSTPHPTRYRAFADLALLLLRRNGIAARYVSGYLFAPPDGDHRDVPPVKGVCRGAATASLSASVQMQRTDGAAARS